MITVLLIVHLMIALALVGVVLLQRSEGGALGIGGGGGGFMSGRGAANFLTRVTAGLAAAFFVTSLGLTLLVTRPAGSRSIFDTPAPASAPAKSAPADKSQPAAPAGQPAQPGGGVLEKLAPSPAPTGPQVPRSQ